MRGPFLWATVLLSIGLITVALAPWRARRLATSSAVAVVAFGIAAIGMRLATRPGWIEPALPVTTVPWVAAVVFALLWSVVGWRSSTVVARGAAVAAVPATTLMALVLFNAFFFYFPTWQSLIGAPAANVAAPSQVRAIDEVAHRRADDPVGIPLGSGGSLHGETFSVQFPASISHFSARPGWVYLPPAWFGPERHRLPVVELIGGTPSSPAEWLRGASVDRFEDAFAARHRGMAPILAMVDENGSLTGDSECVDRPGARAETYVLRDIRRDLISQFAATPDPRRWGVAGLSEGGTCALDLALRHPHDFGAFGDFGGEAAPSIGSAGATLQGLFGGSRSREAGYDPGLLFARHAYRGLDAMFVVGRQDPLRPRLLHQAIEAKRAGMVVAYHEVDGGHTFWVWRAAFADFLPFAWSSLGGSGAPSAPRGRSPHHLTVASPARVSPSDVTRAGRPRSSG